MLSSIARRARLVVFALALAVPAISVLAPIASAADVLSGCARNGTYFDINLTTGITTTVGTLPLGVTEIEYDPASGRAFAQGVDGSFYGFEFDPRTAAMIDSLIPNGGSYTGLEFVGGTLYGTAITSPCAASELRILDPWTGSSTLVGLTGRGPISGLAYDAATSTMYGITGCSGGNSHLVTLNLATGVATEVGPVGFEAGSLEFGPDGNLYAGASGLGSGNLYRVSPSTAAGTLLGSPGLGGITGLMLHPGCSSAFTQIQLAGGFTSPAYDLTASPQMTPMGNCTWRGTIHLEPGIYPMKFVTDGALDTPPDYGTVYGPHPLRVPGGPYGTQAVSGQATDLYLEVVNPDDYTFTLNERSLTWGATAAGGVPTGGILGMVLYDAGFSFPPYPLTTVNLYRGTTLVLSSILSRFNSSFSFGELGPGDYNLKVMADGYTPAEAGPVPVALGTTTVPDITLLSVPSAHSRIDVVGDFNAFAIGAHPMTQVLNGFWSGPPIALVAGSHQLKFVTDGLLDSPNDYGTNGSLGAVAIPGSGDVALNSGPASFINLFASHAGTYEMQLDERNLTFSVFELPPPLPAIDVNNIRMVIPNAGQFAFDFQNGQAGLEYPRGSGKTAMFAAGLWLSSGSRATVSEYADEFAPGAMIGASPDDPNRPEYRVYKLERSYASTAARDAALADYSAGALPHGAPPVAVLPGGELDIPGDQMLWHVYNDASPAYHTVREGSSAPLGIEIQQTAFAYNRPGPLGNTVFMKFRIENKSGFPLTDMRVGSWSDPDLGDFTDDLVGCDPARSLGFCYNSTNNDAVYGSSPPAIGIDLLQGPIDQNTRRDMTAFIKYINGTDPVSPAETVNYLHGLNADGSAIVDPTTSLATTFMLSGDPIGQSGWLDAVPSDRRMLISSGPFSMAPGAAQEIWLAILMGAGSDRLASIQSLRLTDDAVQQTFDAGFAGPTAVEVSLAGTEVAANRALITWQIANRSAPVTVYRAESGVAWRALGTRIPDGSGRVQFEDTAVRPASRYGYRLGVIDRGVEVAAGEVWVTTPAGAEFALRGMSPNPAIGELWVSFSLPDDAAATLELLDLSGRRVLAADAGHLGAGTHRLSLGKAANVPPGVYLVRLRHGGRTLIAKAAVVR